MPMNSENAQFSWFSKELRNAVHWDSSDINTSFTWSWNTRDGHGSASHNESQWTLNRSKEMFNAIHMVYQTGFYVKPWRPKIWQQLYPQTQSSRGSLHIFFAWSEKEHIYEKFVYLKTMTMNKVQINILKSCQKALSNNFAHNNSPKITVRQPYC